MDVNSFIATYGRDLLIILGSVAILLTIGKVIYYFIHKKLKTLASKTKTTIDDKIIEILEKPIYLALFIGGLHFSLNFTSIVTNYLDMINKAFSVAWVILGVYLSTKIFEVILEEYKKKLGVGITYLIKKLILISVGAIGLMMILKIFNIEISPLVASLGIAGLAVALALQDTLANFFSGIYLTADRPIRPGDFIELNDTIKGTVLDIGWRSTRLKTPQNNIIIIPNKKLAESIIINYSLPNSIITTSVLIDASYKNNPKKIEKVIYETAKKIRDKMDECVKDFDPVVRFYEFGDYGLRFKVFLRVKSRGEQFVVGHELRKALYDSFKKNKIEIPYPTHDIFLHKAK
ncbi:MAG: mechanosensitive ion channel family protein [Nanoarchaeota archaeon]|nr:mechanosensitive ion channel family protein [Nanoarchaeota archaeon]